MSTATISKKNKPDEQRSIGTIEVSSSHNYSLRCDSLSSGEVAFRGDVYHAAMTISAIGPGTAIRALRSVLQSGRSTKAFIRTISMPNARTLVRGHHSGYRSFVHPLTDKNYHLVMVAKDTRLMLDGTENALWRVLNGNEFTTPILRSWMPWMLQHMLVESCLRDDTNRYSTMVRALESFQSTAHYLCASTQSIDAVVTTGIQSQNLRLE